MGSLAKGRHTVDRALRIVENLKNSFETQAETFKRAEARRHNERLPCNRVPDEILSAIFTVHLPSWNTSAYRAEGLLVDDYVEFRRTLGMVCSKWNAVLRNTARCWSVFRYYAGNIADFPEDVGLVLSRGMHTPLNVVLELCTTHITPQQGVDEIIALFSPHLPRIRRLSISTNVHAFFTMMPWVHSLPGLKHLRLVPDWEPPEEDGAQVPTLSHAGSPLFSLASFCICRDPDVPFAASPRALGDVTLLADLCTEFSGDAQTVLQMFTDLSQCTSLERLDLVVSISTLEVLELFELSFPKLRVLKLQNETNGPIIPFKAPALESLTLNAASRALFQATVEPLAIAPTRYHNLRQLSVPIWDGVQMIVSQFVAEMPSLKQVVFRPTKSSTCIQLLDCLQLRVRVRADINAGRLPPHISINLPMAPAQHLEKDLLPALERLLIRSPCQQVTLHMEEEQWEKFGPRVSEYSTRVHFSEDWVEL